VTLESLREESAKLVGITRYMVSQYGKAILARDSDARGFLTDVYLRGHPEERGKNLLVPTIPCVPLSELFPGIGSARLKLLARYDWLLADRFDRGADNLLCPKELLALCALVAHLKPASIFEIGTYRGATIANLALNAPEGARLRTLDKDLVELEDSEVVATFQGKGIERIHSDSKLYDYSPLHGSVDLVFVDGWHSNPEVDRDTENALKLVSPGGVIVWHDYNREYPDVVDCLRRLSRRLPLAQARDTALVIARMSAPPGPP